MLSDLLIVRALVLLNGVFAMSEIEIVSSASRLGLLTRPRSCQQLSYVARRTGTNAGH
jgi:CBS domain containing-hemolysin-like protein